MRSPNDCEASPERAVTRPFYENRFTPLFLGLATCAFLLIWWWPFSPIGEGLKTNAPLHTVLEVFAVVVACAIFSVGWYGYAADEADRLAVIASGFIGVAMLDTAHLLSFTGMPDWITPSGNGKAIYFWFGARFLAVASILLFILYDKRPRRMPYLRWLLLAVSLASLASLTWLVLFHVDWLPVFIVPGKGLTALKVTLEWVLILLAVSALYFTFRKRTGTTTFNSNSLMASLWMMILSELCFTLYSDAVDIFSLMGHVFKVFSYAYLYQAIVIGGVKRPYELLYESREILNQLVSNIRHVFWLRTTDRKEILYISGAYEEVFQKSCASLIENPESWTAAIHPEDRARVLSSLSSQKDGKFDQTFRIVRQDGGLRWIRSRSFPIYDSHGNAVRMAGVAENITDAINADNAKIKSEERYRALMKVASDGMHIVDEKGILIDASNSFLSALGYDESALGRLQVWDWDKNVSKEFVLRSIPQLLASEASQVIESEFIRKDGSTYPVEVYLRGVNINGERLIYASARDITERKNSEIERLSLQRQLDQAQKMEAIGHLAGGIAHDFNNMLGAILGYAELIKMQQIGATGGRRTPNYIDEILTAGERAKELISQMLIFSRAGQENLMLHLPAVEFQSVVKEVFRFVRSSIPSTIEVNCKCDDDTLRVRMPPVQLHQIVLNLAINARDALGEYGKIEIFAGRRRVKNELCGACHEKFTGEFAVLEVSDNGKGIPSTIVARIFEPFFTTKEVGKGTGMGLSVVHGLVHSSGGHIQVESDSSIGTIMRVLLPITDAKLPESTEPLTGANESRAEILRGKKIMVIDDERSIGAMLSELLAIHGASVDVFQSSKEAASFFRNSPNRYDLIITDETMPGLSGIDLSMAILEQRPTLPIILCTGYSERVNDENLRALGIRGFLLKPIDIKRLLDVAAELCEQSYA